MRKIAVVTCARMEYGLLSWLMHEIKDDPLLELQTVVTGMHLSPEFGHTCETVLADGFTIDERIEILMSSDTSVGVAKTMGVACISFADALARLKPDIIVLQGDRYEILAIAQTAFVMKIPIAHIHGGEVTHGSLDDSLRHAITKLSHIHFPVAEAYRRRILQLGESEQNVFNYGAPGLDHVSRTPLMTREQLQSLLAIQFRDLNFLLTYHPVTTNRDDFTSGLDNLFSALRQYPDASIFFTKSNADEAGRLINEKIDAFVEEAPSHRYAFTSLGTPRYLSLAKEVDMVIGNSSSGLIEVPFVGTPTVNVGQRQAGRLQANSIINCKEKMNEIVDAIEKARSSEFQSILKDIVSPYGRGDASKKIKDKLKTIELNTLIEKQFCDVEAHEDVHYC